MARWMKLGAPLGAVAIVAGAAVIACGKEGPYHSVSGTGTGISQPANCKISAGQIPDPTCDGASGDCSGIKPGCPVEAKCGDKSTCLPMGDNSGKSTLDLRIRRLTVLAPAVLAQPFVENAIVDKGVNLPACGENGDGSFNWLVRIDKATQTVRTGGSPPSPDPFGVGYCFADTIAGPTHIQSVTAKYTEANGALKTETIPKLNVPIWLHGDRASLVILPLTQVNIQGVTVSPDGNCIGAYNDNAVSADCSDSRLDCARWKTAGALGGYITLEEADSVPLADLGGKSLCVMLTGTTPDANNKCPRGADGKIQAKGDYCSSPAGPDGCKDSYWLAATFAAAAVHINDGANDALCHGGSISTDGGAEGGASDATTD